LYGWNNESYIGVIKQTIQNIKEKLLITSFSKLFYDVNSLSPKQLQTNKQNKTKTFTSLLPSGSFCCFLFPLALSISFGLFPAPRPTAAGGKIASAQQSLSAKSSKQETALRIEFTLAVRLALLALIEKTDDPTEFKSRA